VAIKNLQQWLFCSHWKCRNPFFKYEKINKRKK